MRAAVALGGLLLTLGGCGYGAVSVEGSFGSERFEPTGTVFALIDAHVEVADPTGGVQVEERAARVLRVFLCQPALDPDVDWAGLPGREILALREEVRRGDRALVQDLDLTQLDPGARLEASAQRADFSLAALHGTQPITAADSYAAVKPLGRAVKAALVVEAAELREGGHLRSTLTIVRERASDQPANTATGTVTLRFDAPIVGERIGESNLAALGL